MGKLKEKLNNVHFWLISLSITFYILALFFPAFYVAKENPDDYSCSIFLLLVGWISVFYGGINETLVWFANPLYFISVLLSSIRIKFAVLYVSLAIILAVYFTTLHSIVDGESGDMAVITELGAGFYLWFGSFIMLFIGGMYNCFGTKKLSNDIV